jgi:hypothetical protein
MDALQMKMDAQTRHGTLPHYDRDEDAYHVCELCGGEIDHKGNPATTPDDYRVHAEVLRAMAEWGCATLARSSRSGCKNPNDFYVMAVKICNPHMTIKEVGNVVGLKRWQTWGIYKQIAKQFPAAAKIFGTRTTGSGMRGKRKESKAV